MAGGISGGALAGLAGHYGSDSDEDADQIGKNSTQGNSQRSSLLHFVRSYIY